MSAAPLRDLRYPAPPCNVARLEMMFNRLIDAMPVTGSRIIARGRDYRVAAYRHALIWFLYQQVGGFGFESALARLLERHASTIHASLRRTARDLKRPTHALPIRELVEYMETTFATAQTADRR
jgi:hypothetical protein